MNSSILTHERPISRRTIVVFLLIELVLVCGMWLLPSQSVLLIGGALGGGVLVLLLPVCPQVLFPMMVVATSLDVTGIMGETTSLFTLTIFHFVGGAALVFGGIHFIWKRKTSIPRLELTIPLLLFVAVHGISVLYSANRLEGAVYFFRLTALSLLIYATVSMINTKRWIQWMLGAVLVFGVGMAGFGIFQTLTETYFLPATFVNAVGANVPRAAGTFHNPNDFGTFLMVSMMLSAAFMVRLKFSWKWHPLLFLGFIVQSAGLVTSFSRANWLAALVGLFCISVLTRKLKLLGVVFVIFFVIIGVITLISPNFADLVFGRFLSIFKTFTEFGSFTRVSATARVQFVMGAFSMFLDHPFLGIGARAFPVLFDQYKPVDFPIWLPTRESHTLPATILAELGVVGFAISIWLVWVVFKAGFRAIRSIEDEYLQAAQLGLFVVFVGYQVSMIFTGAITDNFLWIMIGMLFAVREVGVRAEKIQVEAEEGNA
ncbi:MAG: O-antigen ligase family protein [Candidatus Latescibacterota bacterium]